MTFPITSTADRDCLTFDFQKIWQIEADLTAGLNAYTALFREKGSRVYALQLNTFGRSCYADKKNQALINQNGDVFKALPGTSMPTAEKAFSMKAAALFGMKSETSV